MEDLEIIISGILRLAKHTDCHLTIKRVEKEGYLLQNEKKTKIAAVGQLNIMNENGEHEKVLGAFSIDINKYRWAEAEGFTQDQMVDKLTNEIFNLIGVDEVFDFLCEEE